MNKLLKSLLIMVVLFSGSTTFAAVELGKDYKMLNPSQPTSSKKIEVLEFFFYGCSHCFNLHKPLSAWEKAMPKDVELTFVPTIFRNSMEPMARTMYAPSANSRGTWPTMKRRPVGMRATFSATFSVNNAEQ